MIIVSHYGQFQMIIIENSEAIWNSADWRVWIRGEKPWRTIILITLVSSLSVRGGLSDKQEESIADKQEESIADKLSFPLPCRTQPGGWALPDPHNYQHFLLFSNIRADKNSLVKSVMCSISKSINHYNVWPLKRQPPHCIFYFVHVGVVFSQKSGCRRTGKRYYLMSSCWETPALTYYATGKRYIYCMIPMTLLIILFA